MIATVCTGCDEVIVEHGRGHVHLLTGNYRCTWARSGDGFACLPLTPEARQQELSDAYEGGYDAGSRDAETRFAQERQAGYDEGYADARSNYDINDF